MKLKVLIHRQTEMEPGMGTLRAYVVQGSKRGDNLLAGHTFKKVDSAIERADAVLLRSSELCSLDIEYIVEDWMEPVSAIPQNEKDRDSARDSVGGPKVRAIR